ncbi:hypothetical protein CASFOL_038322 [Castilleja foliolosa]|uniref:FMR1-interacting protein 1 conserved domain-containing protein n=1 Tax=Castilleja foliolosa TaxID=1961234 RepID=A0ABD3BLJ4_9LAMI
MHPQSSSHQYNHNNQLTLTPGNLSPNQMHNRPQFQVGLLNNHQLPAPPFTYPNAFFAATQFSPFLQSPSQMQMANYGPQNFGPFVKSGMFQANGNGIVPQLVDVYGINHLNHNAGVAQGFGSPQTQGDHISFSPDAAKSQEYIFNKNEYHRQNAQGSSKLNNENGGGKGNKNNGVKNLFSSNPAEQIQCGKKRSQVLNYTEQEIQQWREARRKNHPSNGNMGNKSKENPIQSELMDEAAKMRRQQLKEILAKQAELGCEVAEVPSYYLSDSELHSDGRKQNRKKSGNKNNGVKNMFSSNSEEQIQHGKKRSLVLNYTEKEYQQWREARRKNHPSRSLVLNYTEQEIQEWREARRKNHPSNPNKEKQLKELLAKQDVLGSEVAEVPSYYLSDSELHTDGREQNSKKFGKREKFRSKSDRESKFHQFDKRRKLDNRDPAKYVESKRSL